jgi:hypothetical protein
MARSSKKRDSIPEHFKSIEEAAESWESHDLADYWDVTSEAHYRLHIASCGGLEEWLSAALFIAHI